MRPHRWQPTRLLCRWDSPGKNSAVGCHFLLQCMKVKSQSEVAQSCPTLSDPMDCSLPGSSVHGIFQARVLEWGAVAFSICRINSTLFQEEPRRLGVREVAKSRRDQSDFTFFFFNFKIELFYVQNNGPNSNTPGLECRKQYVDKRIIAKIISSALKRS